MLADAASLIAPVAAAVGAMGSVLAFYMFFAASQRDATVKKRMASVKSARGEMRERAMGMAAAKESAGDRYGEIMRDALKKFQMEEMINSRELKMKLASAGKRGRSEAVKFLFMRIALPPVLMIGGLFYIHFIFQPEDFDFSHYMIAAAGLFGLGYLLPGILLTNARQKRQKDILRAYPDALDLLTICVESGMSTEQAFNRVSREIGGQSIALAEELQITTAELSYLGDRRQAFENLADRTGLSQVRAITSALVQAERYGTPIGQAFRVIGAESREERRARVEQKAASLPAKLTVPMMVFFLPGLFVVLIGPAIIQSMELT